MNRRRSNQRISFSSDVKSYIFPNMTKNAKVSITDFGQISSENPIVRSLAARRENNEQLEAFLAVNPQP